VELEIVGRNVGHGEENHAFEEVENRRRKPVRLHALPLFSDEKILIGLHAVIKINTLIELQSRLVFPANPFRSNFRFSHIRPPI
jgi:hypothetical protein